MTENIEKLEQIIADALDIDNTALVDYASELLKELKNERGAEK